MRLSYYNKLEPSKNLRGWKSIIILKQKTSREKEGWPKYASNLFPDPNKLEGQFNNSYKPDTDAIL